MGSGGLTVKAHYSRDVWGGEGTPGTTAWSSRERPGGGHSGVERSTVGGVRTSPARAGGVTSVTRGRQLHRVGREVYIEYPPEKLEIWETGKLASDCRSCDRFSESQVYTRNNA
jgi:hypothetical protein